MKLRTLADMPAVRDKRVLLRADFNVPIHDGKITDDTRIRETLPTLRALLNKGATVIIVTHLGRPEGRSDPSLRLDIVAKKLQLLLKTKVIKLDEISGASVEKFLLKMPHASVVMLENIRFDPREEACAPSLCRSLSRLADFYVNDAFAAAHRKHASTAGVARLLPAFAGLLLEKEVKQLSPLLDLPNKSLTLIVGGAKVDTKIGILKEFIGKAKAILVGGALANTFLAAQGFDIGDSLFEEDKLEIAQEILLLAEAKKQTFVLPRDVIVADTISHNAKIVDIPPDDVEGDMKILDIGSRTRAEFGNFIRQSQFVFWNGPVGCDQYKPFSGGTRTVFEELKQTKAATFIGGGDTIDAMLRLKFHASDFTFVSTGGGATLEFLEGRQLPGLAVLKQSASPRK